MENENTSLWNKKQSDLTVGDIVKLNLAIPAIVLGSMVGVTLVAGAVSAAASKFRKNRSSNPDTTETK